VSERCKCRGVGMGTYANQETVTTPAGKIVGIDRCLLNDVRKLWADGIETIESCCGHGQTAGYIAVPLAHHATMTAQGWTLDQRANCAGIFTWPREQ
jgi:hypothetical protein